MIEQNSSEWLKSRISFLREAALETHDKREERRDVRKDSPFLYI